MFILILYMIRFLFKFFILRKIYFRNIFTILTLRSSIKYFQKTFEKYKKIKTYRSYIRKFGQNIFWDILILQPLIYICTHNERSGHGTVIIYARYRVSRSFAVDRGYCDRDQRHAIGIRKHLTVRRADFSRFAIGSIDHSALFRDLFKDRFDGNICFPMIQCLIIKYYDLIFFLLKIFL